MKWNLKKSIYQTSEGDPTKALLNPKSPKWQPKTKEFLNPKSPKWQPKTKVCLI